MDKVKSALDAKDDDRLEFSELKDLLEEANERKYPASDLFEALTLTVEEAEKCQTVANQLGSKKVRAWLSIMTSHHEARIGSLCITFCFLFRFELELAGLLMPSIV